jgi:CubicO group peptidase (beta-lactamase class C family)
MALPRRVALSGMLFAIALAACSNPRRGSAEGTGAPTVYDIQQALRFVPDRMDYFHVPGLSLACIHNGSLEWTQSFGAAKAGEPVTSETLFQASSISMPVTAVAVLRLAEQGKVNLDADVNQYLTSWKLPNNKFTAQKKVTLRELLSHTAGVSFAGYPGYASGEAVPTLVQELSGEKPANSAPVRFALAPGKEYQYAPPDYAIIQQILVDATGEPFPKLMRELVLDPMHMAHSTFEQPVPQQLQSLAAIPFDRDGSAIGEGPHTYPEMAVAGLWTTPSDLALFALGIQNALAGAPGAIVSPSTTHEMLQPVLGNYGLGFSIAGSGSNRYFWHPGANLGFLSVFFAYDKGDGMILMSNQQNAKALMLETLQAVAKQYGWSEFPRN